MCRYASCLHCLPIAFGAATEPEIVYFIVVVAMWHEAEVYFIINRGAREPSGIPHTTGRCCAHVQKAGLQLPAIPAAKRHPRGLRTRDAHARPLERLGAGVSRSSMELQEGALVDYWPLSLYFGILGHCFGLFWRSRYIICMLLKGLPPFQVLMLGRR